MASSTRASSASRAPSDRFPGRERASRRRDAARLRAGPERPGGSPPRAESVSATGKVLVVDVGTSSVRAAIMGADGTLGAGHERELLPDSPADGLVEFD